MSSDDEDFLSADEGDLLEKIGDESQIKEQNDYSEKDCNIDSAQTVINNDKINSCNEKNYETISESSSPNYDNDNKKCKEVNDKLNKSDAIQNENDEKWLTSNKEIDIPEKTNNDKEIEHLQDIEKVTLNNEHIYSEGLVKDNINDKFLNKNESNNKDDNTIKRGNEVQSRKKLDLNQDVKTKQEGLRSTKKPREKLGERLGNKKIGARITKPLVGISSDSLLKEDTSLQSSKDESSSYKTSTQNDKDSNSDTKCNKSLDEDWNSNWGNSWGDWGSTLLTAASTLSKEVTRGVGTVIETVETSLGVPDPEELAREHVQASDIYQREKINIKDERHDLEKKDSAMENFEHEQLAESGSGASFGFDFSSIGSLVSNVSGAFETASNKVLFGGLDTLEKIGRKTMDIIQDGDPGLRRKRAFLKHNKPNLSFMLREARDRALVEQEERSRLTALGEYEASRESVVGLAWNATEGPAHMEALGLVAKQCQLKTKVLLLPTSGLEDLHREISILKTYSCLDETHKIDDDISAALMTATRDIQLPLHFAKLLTGWPSLQDHISKMSIEIMGGLGAFDDSVTSDMLAAVSIFVAEMAALCHKAAEVALVTPGVRTTQLAKQFQRICGIVSGALEKCADDVCEALSCVGQPDISQIITNIYVQMAELNSYLETSLQDLNTVVIQVEAKRFSHEL